MDVGVDAYATVEEVTTYLEARNASAAWDAAETEDQEAAIIEATSFLDAAFTWVGQLEDCEQTLGWPRLCAYDRERRPLEGIPTTVKSATAELANLALGGRLMPMSLMTEQTGIKSERIGDVETVYDPSIYLPTYGYVQLLLRGIGGMSTGDAGNGRLIRA